MRRTRHYLWLLKCSSLESCFGFRDRKDVEWINSCSIRLLVIILGRMFTRTLADVLSSAGYFSVDTGICNLLLVSPVESSFTFPWSWLVTFDGRKSSSESASELHGYILQLETRVLLPSCWQLFHKRFVKSDKHYSVKLQAQGGCASISQLQ
jgi:hypothetical protein